MSARPDSTRSGRAASATRGAGRSTDSPGTSGSAMSARAGTRRSIGPRSTEKASRGRGVNYGWRTMEGRALLLAGERLQHEREDPAGRRLQPFGRRLLGHRRLRLPRLRERRPGGPLRLRRLLQRPDLVHRARRPGAGRAATVPRHQPQDHLVRRGRGWRAVRHGHRRRRAAARSTLTGLVATATTSPVWFGSATFRALFEGVASRPCP